MKKIALIFTLLTSCGGAYDPYEVIPGIDESRAEKVEICESYTIDRREHTIAIETAVGMWNTAIGRELFIAIDGPGSIELVFTDEINPNHAPNSAKNPAARGGPSPGCAGKITVEHHIADNYATYAHEMGHVLGFRHSEDPASIMYNSSRGGHITEGIVDLVLAAMPPL